MRALLVVSMVLMAWSSACDSPGGDEENEGEDAVGQKDASGTPDTPKQEDPGKPQDPGTAADDGENTPDQPVPDPGGPDEGGGPTCEEMTEQFSAAVADLPNQIDGFAACSDAITDCAIMPVVLECVEEDKLLGKIEGCQIAVAKAKLAEYVAAIDALEEQLCPACHAKLTCPTVQLGCIDGVCTLATQ